MQELPLHPGIVHFPIAIGLILPIFTLIVFISIKKTWLKPQAWFLVLVLQFFLVISSVAAVKTGEIEEERVESIVPHEALEVHEEMAEKVPWAAGLVFALAIFGTFKNSKLRQTAQLTTLLGMLALAFMLFRVGESGGFLVYQHGAANAASRQKN